MGLPLVTALFGLGVAMALGEVLRSVVDVPDWAPATAAMVGIGVGIDYALLIVTRYRTSLAAGQDPRRATSTAIATAGRAVLFAGLTVIISMLGILLMAQPAMNGFAFTVVLAVLATVAASLTLLPAILGFTGHGIERLHVPFVSRHVRPYDASRWFRWSRFVQHRPVDRRGRWVWRYSWRWPRRSSASDSASPTPRTTHRPPPPDRRTTSWPTDSDRDSQPRWC